jgi:hypothetical protein
LIVDIRNVPLETRIELGVERRRLGAEALDHYLDLRQLERRAWLLYFEELHESCALRRAGHFVELPVPPKPLPLRRPDAGSTPKPAAEGVRVVRDSGEVLGVY